MATTATSKTLAQLLNPGASATPAPIAFNVANSTPATLVNKVPLPAFPTATKPSLSSTFAPPVPAPIAPAAPAAAPIVSPIQRSSVPPVTNPVTPPAGQTGAAPVTPAAPAAAASPVNPQWLNADGSFKTPDEIAATIGTALKSAHGTNDIGKLAGEQFAGGNGTTVDAEAEARRIGNTRNDIAVGAADPYGVGASSGIAYTPAELSAIEKAYAGVYDPALDTALAKVTAKQASDKTAADNAAQLEQINAQAKANQETQAKAPYTLGANDVRFGSDGKPIATGAGSGSGSGVYTPGVDPSADAWVQYVKNGGKITDVPNTYQNAVAQGIAQGTANTGALSKTSTDAIGIINQLQNLDLSKLSGTGFVGGIEHPSSLFPGTSVQNTQNLAKQLQATISLANRQQLKGSGAISDFEFRVLGDAATALGLDSNGRTNLSPDDFKKQLGNLELKLQVGPTSLTDDEIQYLASPQYTTDTGQAPLTPDQIRSYSQNLSSVGNTTASTGQNRPQRNNNPGNVKAGGLADSLATGTDDQGHLIFPSADAGFKALSLDLTAKLNGGSKYLPANPTIAQLGSIYAQDPNWPKKVAMMLGVGVNTPTTSVPFEKLVKAIATQEGFYA